MLDTPAAQVPTISLATQDTDPDGFAAAFGESFERFGFAIVADHGIPADLIERAWAETKLLFDLPEDEKRGYHIAGGGGARGFHQQGHGAELVERKETGVGRACLNRERRFQLQQIEKIGLRQPAGRAQPEQLRRIRTGLE